jgi:hypothetical protein
MHATILFFAYWAAAFVSLGAAVVLLGIFYAVINDELGLLGPGKEAVVAGVASLIEGTAVWLVVLFIPATQRALGLRAMILPALIVALIYKLVHLEDWGRFEALLLLLFQVVIGCVTASLLFGRFEAAFMVVAAFAAVMTVIALIARSL